MAPTIFYLRHILAGECIYCQKPSDKLTDEHYIPSGLGGTQIIENASCEDCRKITHSFETTSLRHVLGPGRYWLGIPERRKRSRPLSWPAFKTMPDGTVSKVSIPLDDLPFFLCMPTFKTNPSIRQVLAEEHGPTEENGLMIISEEPSKIDQRLKDYQADHFSFRADHISFARMLAKIALGYCVLNFGYNTFIPMVTPLILGQTNGFPNLVSSSENKIDRSNSPLPLEQRYEHNIFHKISKEGTICVRIDMFKNLEAPSYYVMAGALIPPESGSVLQFSINS